MFLRNRRRSMQSLTQIVHVSQARRFSNRGLMYRPWPDLLQFLTTSTGCEQACFATHKPLLRTPLALTPVLGKSRPCAGNRGAVCHAGVYSVSSPHDGPTCSLTGSVTGRFHMPGTSAAPCMVSRTSLAAAGRCVSRTKNTISSCTCTKRVVQTSYMQCAREYSRCSAAVMQHRTSKTHLCAPLCSHLDSAQAVAHPTKAGASANLHNLKTTCLVQISLKACCAPANTWTCAHSSLRSESLLPHVSSPT